MYPIIIRGDKLSKMENTDDLRYLFEKYLKATEKGKPAPRLRKQLTLALDAHDIYLESKTKQDD